MFPDFGGVGRRFFHGRFLDIFVWFFYRFFGRRFFHGSFLRIPEPEKAEVVSG